MYEALDSYLDVDTWHTSHPLDSRRFFQALDKIVRAPDFDADVMGAYMTRKAGGIAPYRIEQCVTEAWAVRHFLETIREVRGPSTPA